MKSNQPNRRRRRRPSPTNNPPTRDRVRAQAGHPAPQRLDVQLQVPVEDRHAIARRIDQNIANKAYIAITDADVEATVQPFSTEFVNKVNDVQAMTVRGNEHLRQLQKKEQGRALAKPTYQEGDLLAVAEVAYHYLFSGGAELARTLYEGLAAIAPSDAYFALALGLTHDHLDNRMEAHRWYARARALDPRDGRADVNRAELFIEARDFRKAKKLLDSGAQKAARSGDYPLERKARALLRHLDRAA